MRSIAIYVLFIFAISCCMWHERRQERCDLSSLGRSNADGEMDCVADVSQGTDRGAVVKGGPTLTTSAIGTTIKSHVF